MVEDLALHHLKVRDETRPALDGETTEHFKLVKFYLGRHGPFTERLDAAASSADINARVEAIRSTLRGVTS